MNRAVSSSIGAVTNVQEAFGWIVTPSLDRGTFCVLDRQGRLDRARAGVAVLA